MMPTARGELLDTYFFLVTFFADFEKFSDLSPSANSISRQLLHQEERFLSRQSQQRENVHRLQKRIATGMIEETQEKHQPHVNELDASLSNTDVPLPSGVARQEIHLTIERALTEETQIKAQRLDSSPLLREGKENQGNCSFSHGFSSSALFLDAHMYQSVKRAYRNIGRDFKRMNVDERSIIEAFDRAMEYRNVKGGIFGSLVLRHST